MVARKGRGRIASGGGGAIEKRAQAPGTGRVGVIRSDKGGGAQVRGRRRAARPGVDDDVVLDISRTGTYVERIAWVLGDASGHSVIQYWQGIREEVVKLN